MKKKTTKQGYQSGRQLIACSVVYALTNLFLRILETKVYWQVLNLNVWQKISLFSSALWLLAVVLIVGKNPVLAFRQRLVFLLFAGFLLVSILQFPKYTYRQALDMVAARENITAQPLSLVNSHYYAKLNEDNPKNANTTPLLYYDYVVAFDDGTDRTFCFDPNTGEYMPVSNILNGKRIYPLK